MLLRCQLWPILVPRIKQFPQLFAAFVIATVVLVYIELRCNSNTQELTRLLQMYRNQIESSLSTGIRNEDVRCADLPARYPNAIPPLVHWTSKDSRVAAKLQPLVKSWRLLLDSKTVNWQFVHWDDAKIQRLISAHYPQLAKTFAKLANGLERSDIGRLAVLHHVGGVYVDLDVELLRDLSPWVAPPPAPSNSEFSRIVTSYTAVWSQEPIDHAVFLYNITGLISNAVMLSRANHSFLSLVLREFPAWYETNWVNKTRDHYAAALITGPLMLQSFYERYANLTPADRPPDWSSTLLAEPDTFQPLWDVHNVPHKLKHFCSKLEELSEVKQMHCERLTATNFQTKSIPAQSFTVHRYLHLSYTDKMDLSNSARLYDLLPILTCTI